MRTGEYDDYVPYDPFAPGYEPDSMEPCLDCGGMVLPPKPDECGNSFFYDSRYGWLCDGVWYP